MRITFVLASTNLSGGTKVMATYARILSQKHEVEILAPRSSFIERKRGSGLCLYEGLNLKIVPKRRLLGSLPDADAIIASWWEIMELVNKAPPRKGAKIHLVQDHEVFDHLPVDRVQAVYRLPIVKVAVSGWLRDILEAQYGAHQVELIPNAVDTSVFNSPPRSKQAVPTFGFLYSEAPRKGISLCLAALERARQEVPSLRAVCFGKARLISPNWMTYFRFPAQRTIPHIYASCDAWLYPSISEGFGLPVLEAMACRTPVIGTSAGAGREYISDATGALVEPNVESFVRGILTFANMDDSVWRSKAEAAREGVVGYDWPTAGSKFEAFINRLVSDSAR